MDERSSLFFAGILGGVACVSLACYAACCIAGIDPPPAAFLAIAGAAVAPIGERLTRR